MAGAFLLAAMLGQLDTILAPWYCDTSKTWEFPFIGIFNKPISSLLGWEIIYALIIVAFILVFACGFMLGKIERKVKQNGR